MPDFSRRSTENELMDTENVTFAEFDDCLRNLEFINKATLAYRPTLKWIRSIAVTGLNNKISIMDIGSGGGDMIRKIAAWAAKNHINVELTGIDINPWSKKSAEQIPADPQFSITYRTADLFSLDDSEKPDIIISSLFTHHLFDSDLIGFIQWMHHHSRVGWHINDLHRHPLPYYFIKLITAIFPFNRLVKHDAAISVARSFTRKDWKKILKDAHIDPANIVITWFFPFRYIVSCRKS